MSDQMRLILVEEFFRPLGQVKKRMLNNTMTLALSGDVPFDSFAKAMSSFNSLVSALGTEHDAGGDIQWFVDALEKSSALATIRGESTKPEKVEAVVTGYTQIATALEARGPMPTYRARTLRHAHDIVALLNHDVVSVRFETATEDHIVSSPPFVGVAPLQPAYGAVEGRVQTLSNRQSLRFTLFDSFHDRAVSCYMVEGHEETMRGAWDKRAVVEGMITRDPSTGRPLAVRHVTSVRTLPDEEADYREARGAIPYVAASPTPEELIRRLRDG